MDRRAILTAYALGAASVLALGVIVAEWAHADSVTPDLSGLAASLATVQQTAQSAQAQAATAQTQSTAAQATATAAQAQATTAQGAATSAQTAATTANTAAQAATAAAQNVAATFVPYTNAQAAAASPVQSVNGGTGAVTVPAYKRQVSTALTASTTDGTLTWTFPTAFTNMPTCWPSLAATTTAYTFDYPEVTAISLTSVSYLVTAHPKSISITSLTLPIVLQVTPPGAPAGTTLTLSCLAPQ